MFGFADQNFIARLQAGSGVALRDQVDRLVVPRVKIISAASRAFKNPRTVSRAASKAAVAR